MTQEELDSLMDGEPDVSKVDGASVSAPEDDEVKKVTIDPNDFRAEADKKMASTSTHRRPQNRSSA